ncbi:hypothetical protein LXL04_032350 [Taraxacum kok-saghyz]
MLLHPPMNLQNPLCKCNQSRHLPKQSNQNLIPSSIQGKGKRLRNQLHRRLEMGLTNSRNGAINAGPKEIAWYPNISEEEFTKACPFCLNKCNCKACLRAFSPKFIQGYSCSKSDKIRYSKLIIQKVLPFVRRLHEDQLMEKLIEASVKGLPRSELQLQDAECEVDDNIFCDKCGAYVYDFYRSCACGYDVCLVCTQDLHKGKKLCTNGGIHCPPIEIGGCNEGVLELKHIMPVDWVENMLEKAQRIYKINTRDDNDNDNNCTKCGTCYDSCNESIHEIQPKDMQHFQFHWSKGEPMIVNDVVSSSSGISWEPMVLWRAFRDVRSKIHDVNAIDCSNWKEVSVDLYKFFRGYSESGPKRVLKLEDWQPLYEGESPRHFVEFIGCLPFKDYTHPQKGYVNVAIKLPELSSKPDMGPRMDIGYGNSVTKLHYDRSDTVNVLTHTNSPILTSIKIENAKIKMVEENHGALWDIFRRQDIHKLEKYLMSHSNDLLHNDCHLIEKIVHPIHDRIFYLNMEHKRKLKEEFGIEPWTFKQKLGDAVFIPAGCPYQVTNLNSATKVEVNFVSPESLGECIRLQNEIRMLPNNHRAKQNRLNIWKMMLYALEHAAMDLSSDSNDPINDLKVPETPNGDNANISNHTNGWVDDTESSDNESDHRDNQEASRTLTADTSADPHEGMWRGNVVGPEVKKLLETVEHQYPTTFEKVQIRAKDMWISILKEFHAVVKGFLEASVEVLDLGRLGSLREDLKELERFGFDMSWAHKRMDMVERLKFGKEPLGKELVALEESLKPLKERLGGRWKEYVEAREMLKAAQLEYDNASEALKKKAREVAHKFGDGYDQVLKGNLGFGMLEGSVDNALDPWDTVASSMLKNRSSPSLQFLPTAAAVMSLRPSPSYRGGRNQWRGRGFSNRPHAPATDSIVSSNNDNNGEFRPDYNPPPPRFHFRPNSNPHFNQSQSVQPRGQTPPPYSNPYQQFAPPPLYYQNQQFQRQGHPRPQFNSNQQFRPPPFYNQAQQHPNFDQNQQFRPQRQPPQPHGQFRPQQRFQQRPSKPLDYRNWEHAKPGPPPGCERFTVLSYNILADYLAINHRNKLYFHIPRHILDWEFRKRNIMFELGLWSADILCFQEVDRFQEFEEDLKIRGYSGIWKMRTGEAVDGCAIFWRSSRFKLVHEEAIEFNKLGLRDNVAQICVLESLKETNSAEKLTPACPNKVVICNIHVLFNPKRGEIKLGQVRVLLERAYATSKLWDNAPVVLCGDFNSTPKSSLYNFISDQKLNVSELPRNKISGQESAEIRPKRPFTTTLRPQSTDTINTTQSPNNKEVQQEDEKTTSSPTDTTNEHEKTEGNSGNNILVEESTVTSSSSSSRDEIVEGMEDISVNVSEEDSASFLSELHGDNGSNFVGVKGNETSDADLDLTTPEVLDYKSGYDPSGWTPMEIEAATGSSECTTMEHSLRLRSTYTEVEDYSGTRDSNGEPQVTSYHRSFQGTVDYIWRSEGVETVRVLAPIPKQAMQWTPGFPTKRWGSDHVALVAELAFSKEVNDEKTQV